jgi:hypothetical protein
LVVDVLEDEVDELELDSEEDLELELELLDGAGVGVGVGATADDSSVAPRLFFQPSPPLSYGLSVALAFHDQLVWCL